MGQTNIIIFDGVCNLCNGVVRFIIQRDPEEKFVFTPMQSDYAKTFITRYHASGTDLDTFLLIKNGRCFTRSDAAMEITRDLSGYWHLLRLCKIVPKPIRNYFYNLIARNRYKLFGQRMICMVPTEEMSHRFRV